MTRELGIAATWLGVEPSSIVVSYVRTWHVGPIRTVVAPEIRPEGGFVSCHAYINMFAKPLSLSLCWGSLGCLSPRRY